MCACFILYTLLAYAPDYKQIYKYCYAKQAPSQNIWMTNYSGDEEDIYLV